MRRNLEYICECGLQHKCKIRIPRIPGYTSKQHIERTEHLVRKMGFNNIDIFDYVLRKEICI